MISRNSLREIVRVMDSLRTLSKRLSGENESSLAGRVSKVGDALWEETHREFAYPLVDELREELNTRAALAEKEGGK